MENRCLACGALIIEGLLCSEHASHGHIVVETEVYSRVCGYLRPTTAWNKGKQQEFSERKTFEVSKMELGHV